MAPIFLETSAKIFQAKSNAAVLMKNIAGFFFSKCKLLFLLLIFPRTSG